MFVRSFSVRRAHPSLILLIALVSSAGCAASERHELAARDVQSALDLRANGPRGALDAAQLAGLDALALPRPSADECADARTSGFWRASALIWNPEVRAARREVERALASAGVARRPGSIEVALEAMDFADIGRETKLALTVDLLALTGFGPTRLAREEARGEVARTRAALESAVWSAMFDVERARVRLAASRERQRRLNQLQTEVAAQSERFEILERRGRLSEADVDMVQAASHEIEHERSSERGREAEARAELARVSGMPFDHDAFASVDGLALNEVRHVPPAVDAHEFLEREPALRELLLEYAQAEVRVRRAAADVWPTLRAGPLLTLMPSDLLFGGVLDLSLPWPGRVEKEVRVASAQREAARERVEDALHQTIARAESLRTIEGEARARATEHAVMLDDAQESAWQAVNARLRLGMASAVEWARGLRERIDPLVGLVNEREAAAVAALDLAQASGVAPRAVEVLP